MRREMKKLRFYFKFVFFFFLINLFSFKALSFCEEGKENCIEKKDCPNIDIRDNMTQEMKEYFSTPKNQGEIGWCYAFVASDLLSAHLNQPVSAFYLASFYNYSLIQKTSLLVLLISLTQKTLYKKSL